MRRWHPISSLLKGTKPRERQYRKKVCCCRGKIVCYPGEIEGLREQQRLRDEIEDATWGKLRALASEYRLDTALDLA